MPEIHSQFDLTRQPNPPVNVPWGVTISQIYELFLNEAAHNRCYARRKQPFSRLACQCLLCYCGLLIAKKIRAKKLAGLTKNHMNYYIKFRFEIRLELNVIQIFVLVKIYNFFGQQAKYCGSNDEKNITSSGTGAGRIVTEH